MAKGYFVDKAIDEAVFVLEKIDERWPSLVNSFSAKQGETAQSRRPGG
jgi:hypothetical protein